VEKELDYDFIFAGAGAATLQIVQKLIQSGGFTDKQLLILERDSNKKNDRTWCFWETKTNTQWSEHIVKEWDNISFRSSGLNLKEKISPLSYKMMRSASYYSSMRTLIEQHSNIRLLYEGVVSFEEHESGVRITTNEKTYNTKLFFNSMLDWRAVQQQKRYPVLQQHFVGWFIKTQKPHFDADTATFMDFTVAQKGSTRFMYILPKSDTEALIEYTLFSKEKLKPAAYERELRAYLSEKDIRDYTIEEQETGSIPMTCYPFAKQNSKHILHIGSAGGWTKPSTGFTFAFIERKATALVNFLKSNTDMRTFEKRNRFWWYDLLFLDVLARHNHKGGYLFSRMFQYNKPERIFRFLEEKSTPKEEVKIMRSFPLGLFVGQVFRRLLRTFH
jgi:lycopene beta-cyclase